MKDEMTFTMGGRYYKVCSCCGSVVETNMNGEHLDD